MRDLHGAAPEVLHRETGGGRWAGEDVMGCLRGGAAFGTQVGVRDADGVPVGVEAGAVAGPQLGQGGTVVAGEGGLRGGDVGSGALQDSVHAAVGQVGSNGGCVDVPDGGAVVGWVGCTVVLEELGDLMAEGRLERRDSGPRAGILGDQGNGRVGGSQCTGEELRTQHGEVVGQREDF